MQLSISSCFPLKGQHISLNFFFKQLGDDVSDCAVLFNSLEPDFFMDVFPQVDG